MDNPQDVQAVEAPGSAVTREPFDTQWAALARGMSTLSLAAASVWAFAFLVAQRELLPKLLSHNELSLPLRRWLLVGILVAAGGGMVGSGIFILRRRNAAAVAALDRVALLVAPLVLLWPLPVLLTPACFAGRELHLSLIALGYGLGLERLLRPCLRTAHPLLAPYAARLKSPLCSKLPWVLALGAAVFFASYFSWYSVMNHLRLQTASWDLAIFDNMMWNLIRGEWFKASPVLGRVGSHLQYHATFVAYLLAPFYALRQQADTLLIIQSVLIGMTCIPLYLLAEARTGSAWVGLLLAVAYGLHAPLHGPLFYDFHFLTIAPFFITWVLYFYVTGRRNWLLVAWLVALSVREEQSATMAAGAFFFLLSNERPRWAITGGLLCLVYFVGMKFGIMPLHRSSQDKETFTWIFKGLIPAGTHGFGGVVQTIVSNPIFVLESLFDEEKLIYVLKTFGPVLLLPLRNARNWLLFIPATVFTLLSSGYKPLYQTYFQYTSNWTPFVFFGTAVALSNIKKLRQGLPRFQAASAAVLVTMLIFSVNQGAVLGRHNFRGGFRTVQFERTPEDVKRYKDLMSLAALIPPDASVAATETEAPHVSNRVDCFTMRFGHDDADYLLLAIPEARQGNTKKHTETALKSGNYGLLRRSGDFMLWQRGAPQAHNAAGMRALGIRP